LGDPSIYIDSITGGDGACGLRADHTAVCWVSGQDPIQGQIQRSFELASNVTQLGMFGANVCALDFAGAMQCFSNFAPSQSPPGTFRSLSVGPTRTCGLDVNGTVQCTPAPISGDPLPLASIQLLKLAEFDYAGSILYAGLTADGRDALLFGATPSHYKHISIGGLGRCALNLDTTVDCNGEPGPEAMGLPKDGYIGVFVPRTSPYVRCARGSDHLYRCWSRDPSMQPVPTEPVVSLSANSRSVCAILMDGSVQCTGADAETLQPKPKVFP
jgi:hypothetical protein